VVGEIRNFSLTPTKADCMLGSKERREVVTKIITKSDLIASTAERYRQRFCIKRGNDRAGFGLRLSHNEHHKLLLQATTEDDIEHVIGNRHWTRNQCDECEQDKAITVQFGEEPGYESSTVNVCLDCLKKAVLLASHSEAHLILAKLGAAELSSDSAICAACYESSTVNVCLDYLIPVVAFVTRSDHETLGVDDDRESDCAGPRARAGTGGAVDRVRAEGEVKDNEEKWRAKV
jgi:hypothetical protein